MQRETHRERQRERERMRERERERESARARGVSRLWHRRRNAITNAPVGTLCGKVAGVEPLSDRRCFGPAFCLDFVPTQMDQVLREKSLVLFAACPHKTQQRVRCEETVSNRAHAQQTSVAHAGARGMINQAKPSQTKPAHGHAGGGLGGGSTGRYIPREGRQ